MADLSVTAASVLQASGAATTQGIAGATITQGQATYLDTTTNTWKLARANSATTAGSGTSLIGISLVSCVSGQPIVVQTSGGINPGATVAIGTQYVLSAAVAGNIAPIADLTTGNICTLLGIATTASNIALAPNPTTIVHA